MSDLSEEDSLRWGVSKRKEKLQKEAFLGNHVLPLLSRFHADLSFELLPDRKGKGDIRITTKYGRGDWECKAFDVTFTYWHGDPQVTTTYEHNFSSRGVCGIFASKRVILPSDNQLPVVETPTPRSLCQTIFSNKGDSKYMTWAIWTALQLEARLYPQEEKYLALWSSMDLPAGQCLEGLEPWSGPTKESNQGLFQFTLMVLSYPTDPPEESTPLEGALLDGGICESGGTVCPGLPSDPESEWS